jgi:hypothetical protein
VGPVCVWRRKESGVGGENVLLNVRKMPANFFIAMEEKAAKFAKREKFKISLINQNVSQSL